MECLACVLNCCVFFFIMVLMGSIPDPVWQISDVSFTPFSHFLCQNMSPSIFFEEINLRRRGRRRRKLLDDLKDRRGYSHLKGEALDRTMWRNRFGRGFEPVVRQNTEWKKYTEKNKSFVTPNYTALHHIMPRWKRASVNETSCLEVWPHCCTTEPARAASFSFPPCDLPCYERWV